MLSRTSPLFPYTTLFRSPHSEWSTCVFVRPDGAELKYDHGDEEARPNIGMSLQQWLDQTRSEEHTSELQSLTNLVCRLLLEKKNKRVEGIAPRPTRDSLD